MCRSCWIEDSNSSTERTATTDRLVKLIKVLYIEHPTGGPLHVTLDDWNLEGRIRPYYDHWPAQVDEPVKFFEDGFEEFEGRTLRSICDEITDLLNDMTLSQRSAALAYAQGYIPAGEPA